MQCILESKLDTLKLFYWLHKRATDNKKVRSGEICGGKSKRFLLWFSISQIVLYIYSPQGKLK